MPSDFPSFISQPPATPAPESPEKLFVSLTGRAQSHGYLRGPQQDILRTYFEKHAATPDVGLELPTGTGKTTVGLLIGEWKRRQGQRVAFLCLTNQLAGQVLEEATRLGIDCADLRGGKDSRDPVEEGRYKQHAAIGVTTFSNLWNVNPVVKEADLIIFDDAHGGEQYVSSMWTVSIKRHSDPMLFADLLQALTPAMTQAQVKAIFEDVAPIGVADQADVRHHPSCIDELEKHLGVTKHNARFSWNLLRGHWESCFFLVSANEIAIRPYIAPTHTHRPFADAKQRIYMSATTGDGGDLLRAYGIGKIEVLRSPNPQFGRRYIFVPGLYLTEEESYTALGAVWENFEPKRAVLLSPSERQVNDASDSFLSVSGTNPARLSSDSIADSLVPFTKASNALLSLAGRYDGLDLPDDDCRLLVLAGSPVAVNLMERHLAERWKLTPLFRRRERTRLIQGMGRCTRNATDFAVIFLMGQSLTDAAASTTFIDEFPSELAKEITWGKQQSEWCVTNPANFVAMINGLASNAQYRKGADDSISAVVLDQKPSPLNEYDKSAADEVAFSKAMWEGAYEQAVNIAKGVADRVGGPDMAGYRAWWWYLTSVAAEELKDQKSAIAALERSVAPAINTSWLYRVMRTIKADIKPEINGDPRTEQLWNAISDWGWAGPSFSQRMEQMRTSLKQTDHKQVHQGLETLGRCFGLRTLNPSKQGAPDVVWLDVERGLAIEAKTEKKPSGELYKSDLQEAKGHSDWVRHYEELPAEFAIGLTIVSPTNSVAHVAKPFAGQLHVTTLEQVQELADKAIKAVTELRTLFSGKEFTASKEEFEHKMNLSGLTWTAIDEVFLKQALA